MEKAKSQNVKTERVIEDRDAKSRTIEIKKIKTAVKPDVEVNDRAEIMSDEGPVAETNPKNRAS